ncbi:transcriptional regulator, IclR family [Enhydrobacter aerosaccus]|uniref:Transcriptional regulator, IclR family n=1 Tax=Enhydrobacter aerosaccus TaxID=225324 RepID=A0A1T4T3E8_9HYPH|nr:IclR family transcriptional regulator [Enhydrobacter aerosaccus]SKA35025.1 transcriptional regulator, IclR family [Enhydrobacter aerosaccus]
MSNDSALAENKYIVPALAQGLGILSLFGGEHRSFTAPEIARRLSLPRTKVFRLLQTLQSMDYLRCDESKRHFSLGPALLRCGFEYLASLDMVEVAQPVLQRLRDLTGLSSHMVVRDGLEIVYVSRFPARSTIASGVSVGTRFPVHATIMGRMTILDMDDSQLADLFRGHTMQRFTKQTPTTLKALKALLQDDRKRGYAVSQAFFEEGVSAIAAPVRDGGGHIVAAINVTAVNAHIDEQAMHSELKDAVLEAASEISRWLARRS